MPFANEFKAPVAEFGSDPRERAARGLLYDAWTRVQGFLTTAYGVEKSDPSITFNGTIVTPPQQFRGMQPKTGSGIPYRPGGSATIDSGLVEGPLGDPARRIFAQRLARRSSMGGA
jgi:hypothetical protein